MAEPVADVAVVSTLPLKLSVDVDVDADGVNLPMSHMTMTGGYEPPRLAHVLSKVM